MSTLYKHNQKQHYETQSTKLATVLMTKIIHKTKDYITHDIISHLLINFQLECKYMNN